MLSGFDIICLGSQDWSTPWNVPQQMMSRLSKKNRVLYVEPDRSVLYPLRCLRGERVFRLWLEKLRGRRQEGETLFIYSPPPLFIPFQVYAAVPALRPVNSSLLGRAVAAQASRLGFRDCLLWTYLYTAPEVMDWIPSRLSVYDCIDEWSGVFKDGRLKQAGRAMDRELCRRADLVLVGSRTLLEAKRPLNPHTYYVPHAADVGPFIAAAVEGRAIPRDLAEIPRPIIGFVGILDKGRFDVPLLAGLAKARPDWSLVIVGKALWDGLGIDPEALARLPNVHFVGFKPPGELPAYLQAFDVCVIPYLLNDFTRGIYPLKLHEYLASGKPVVSTRIPAVEEYQDVVYLADTPEEFLASVNRALVEDSREFRERRIEIARGNSWEHRLEEKSRLVTERLVSLAGGVAGDQRSWGPR